MTKNIFWLCLGLTVLLISCKNDSKKSNKLESVKVLDSIMIEHTGTDSQFVPQSTDRQTAENLKSFLVNVYLKKDLPLLQDSDRKFQFYKIDLNEDGNDEIFVRLMSPYFCGSGGCTFLLLDQYGEIITRFTVTRAPIFVEPSKVNEWSLLLVKD